MLFLLRSDNEKEKKMLSESQQNFLIQNKKESREMVAEKGSMQTSQSDLFQTRKRLRAVQEIDLCLQ